MKNLLTIGLPSKGRLKEKAVAFFDDRHRSFGPFTFGQKHGFCSFPNKLDAFLTFLSPKIMLYGSRRGAWRQLLLTGVADSAYVT